jgi:hypothetical protein
MASGGVRPCDGEYQAYLGMQMRGSPSNDSDGKISQSPIEGVISISELLWSKELSGCPLSLLAVVVPVDLRLRYTARTCIDLTRRELELYPLDSLIRRLSVSTAGLKA